MAVRHGYGKLAGTDALVFAYDTGDTINSYKGKPATNILKYISGLYGNITETYFTTQYGTQVVNIPTLGQRLVNYADIYNDYSGGSGRCCINLFGFGNNVAVTGGTTYTYQIIYKTNTGYSHPNYMYRYEYGTSGYIKEGGLHSTARRTELGDGWYHAWGSFTTDLNATYLNTYLFHYEYGTQNRVQVASIMLTRGSEIIPPNQFLGFEQTRSATQGLLDLTGNSSIDLTNLDGYNANAEIDFDGTNDKIRVPHNSSVDITGSEVTFEQVIKKDTNGNFTPLHKELQYTFRITSANQIQYSDSSGWSYSGFGGHNMGIVSGNYFHMVTVKKDGVVTIYVNNLVVISKSWGSSITSTTNDLFIGAYAGDSNFMDGQIPVTKIYNRALTAAEVAVNYNHYRTRFNL
jgi:hypothetical protein